MNRVARWAGVVTGVCASAIVCLSGVLQAREFPVPRGAAEFDELLPFVRGWARENAGDQEMFKRWSLPFGPLSLQVAKANHDEAETLRNLYLGVTGAAFNVDPMPLARSFHCGPSCVDYRRDDLTSKLTRIESLVSRFRALGGVRVVAIWGMGDDYRVNDMFRIMGQQNLTRPSPIMGFVPSGAWAPVGDPDAYLESLGAKPDAVRELLKEMRDLSVAAVVADAGSVVRVVRIGMGDNESGLLFAGGDAAPCTKGEELSDGREVVLVEQVKPRVYFYETN